MLPLITISLSLLGLISAVQYKVRVQTADDRYAGTDDIVTMSVQNENGDWTTLGELDNPDVDDNERGEQSYFVFKKRLPIWSLGRGVRCVRLSIDGDDMWLFSWISVTIKSGYFVGNVHYDNQIFMNFDKVWLSTDETEGQNSVKLCSFCVNC